MEQVIEDRGPGGPAEHLVQVMLADVEAFGKLIQRDRFSHMAVQVEKDVGNGVGAAGFRRRDGDLPGHGNDSCKQSLHVDGKEAGPQGFRLIRAVGERLEAAYDTMLLHLFKVDVRVPPVRRRKGGQKKRPPFSGKDIRMKMDGISPVGHVAINPHAVKTVRGKKQQAARRGAVLLSFHQIVRIPFQKEIDLIKIVAMQGIGFHCLPGGAVAEADLVRVDMCTRCGLSALFFLIRSHFCLHSAA